MNKRFCGMRWPGVVAAMAAVMMLSSATLWADGNIKLQRTSTVFNPCNGETVSGLVDVLLNVKVTQNANKTQVKVHRQFHGDLTGNLGNEYQVSSIGKGEFDATASFYDFEFHSNVIGKGQAPDFELIGNVRVFVDADQQPTGYGASIISSSCK